MQPPIHGFATYINATATGSCSEPEQGEWFTAHYFCYDTSLMHFYCVYILRCKDQKLYIGSTKDLKRRLKEHQVGKNKSTTKRLPIELVYFEGHQSKEDAERRERYFKTAKGYLPHSGRYRLSTASGGVFCITRE